MHAVPLRWTDALDRVSGAAAWLAETLETVSADLDSRRSLDHFRTWVRHVRVGLWDATPMRAAATARGLRWEVGDFLREGRHLAAVEVHAAWDALGDAVDGLVRTAAAETRVESDCAAHAG